jgi:hypothetical protein
MLIKELIYVDRHVKGQVNDGPEKMLTSYTVSRSWGLDVGM